MRAPCRSHGPRFGFLSGGHGALPPDRAEPGSPRLARESRVALLGSPHRRAGNGHPRQWPHGRPQPQRRHRRASIRALRVHLRKVLAERGMAIDEGTLYPLLRRLETQGLLASQWREEDRRPRDPGVRRVPVPARRRPIRIGGATRVWRAEFNSRVSATRERVRRSRLRGVRAARERGTQRGRRPTMPCCSAARRACDAATFSRRASRPDDDAAIRALESGRHPGCHPTFGAHLRRSPARRWRNRGGGGKTGR
jgi:hypothetical protein